MKKLLVFLLCALCALSVSAQTLRLASSESLKPAEAAVLKLLKGAGYEAKITYLPQSRLVQEVGGGQFDGAYFLSDPAIAVIKGLVKVPVVMFNNNIVAVAAKPDVKVTSNADLAKYKVGVERGNANHKEILKGLAKVEVVECDNAASQMKMLAAGRFDVAIMAGTLVAPLAKDAGLSTYYIQQPPVLAVPLYFTLTASGASAEAALTKAFKKVVDDGSWLKDITAAYQPAK